MTDKLQKSHQLEKSLCITVCKIDQVFNILLALKQLFFFPPKKSKPKFYGIRGYILLSISSEAMLLNVAMSFTVMPSKKTCGKAVEKDKVVPQLELNYDEILNLLI